MQVINADKVSLFLDAQNDERKRSAAIAIHEAWLDHSSSLRCSEHLEPVTPLDFQVLYQAAVNAFEDQQGIKSSENILSSGGRIINREQAERKLNSISDPEVAALAFRFANQVIALSESSPGNQDLNYCVELFLKCISDKQVIANVLSGEISRHSNRLADPDFW